ncbi:hypothetical protein BJ912DRAFT_696503 [Pholiota molesta]|nr:hypothetical protein BJ912DRAFT_696503 [Pholiota molesta]
MDSEVFHHPHRFVPERYLEDGPHSNFYFGFGRRICPGMHVAQHSLFIIISRILWAFYISPVKDRNGADALPPIDNFLGGLGRASCAIRLLFDTKKGRYTHNYFGRMGES